MRWIKRILALCLAFCLAFSLAPTFAAADATTQIYLNGEAVATGILQNSRTFVPIRFLSEALGYSVGWDGDTQKVTVSDGEVTNVMHIGVNTAQRYTADAQEEIVMDVAPMLIDSRTYVPLRYVAESLDCGVLWHSESQSVQLTERVELHLNGFSFSPVALNEEAALLQFGKPYDTIDGPDGVRRYIYLNADGNMTVFGFYAAQLFDFFTNDTALVYNGTGLSSFTSDAQLAKSTKVFFDTLSGNKPVALYHCIAGRNYNAYTAEADKTAAMQAEAKLCYYLTNALRRKAGAKDLTLSPALSKVDEAHVASMTENGFFAHEGLGGDSIKDRILVSSTFAHYKKLGEILANMPNAYYACYGWLNSKTHREAMLDDAYAFTGICVDGKQTGNLFFAQVLVKL